MASDSSSGFFLIPNQGYHTFLYSHIQYNQEGGKKEQMNKRGEC